MIAGVGEVPGIHLGLGPLSVCTAATSRLPISCLGLCSAWGPLRLRRSWGLPTALPQCPLPTAHSGVSSRTHFSFGLLWAAHTLALNLNKIKGQEKISSLPPAKLIKGHEIIRSVSLPTFPRICHSWHGQGGESDSIKNGAPGRKWPAPRMGAQPLLGAGHHLDWLHLMCPSQGELRDGHECQTGRSLSLLAGVCSEDLRGPCLAPTSPPMPRLFCVACDYSTSC